MSEWFTSTTKTRKKPAQTLVDEDNTPVVVVGYTTDITETRLQSQMLTRMASTDPLTGLLNRQSAIPAIQAYLAQGTRNPSSLIMFDLDNFKLANDVFGHDFGDTMIVQNARKLKSYFRSDDIVCRIGGDEFCIILRGCKYATGEKKIRQMKEVFHSDHSKEYPKNFCCGIIEVQEEHNENDVMKLLEQADAMMYEQKKEYKKMFQHENC